MFGVVDSPATVMPQFTMFVVRSYKLYVTLLSIELAPSLELMKMTEV